MARQGPGGGESGHSHVVDRWFRALDQRRIRIGLHEWLLQVTGIYADHDDVWIQLADGVKDGGSILLHVTEGTSVEQALRLLSTRVASPVSTRPLVVAVSVTPAADLCRSEPTIV